MTYIRCRSSLRAQVEEPKLKPRIARCRGFFFWSGNLRLQGNATDIGGTFLLAGASP